MFQTTNQIRIVSGFLNSQVWWLNPPSIHSPLQMCHPVAGAQRILRAFQLRLRHLRHALKAWRKVLINHKWRIVSGIYIYTCSTGKHKFELHVHGKLGVKLKERTGWSWKLTATIITGDHTPSVRWICRSLPQDSSFARCYKHTATQKWFKTKFTVNFQIHSWLKNVLVQSIVSLKPLCPTGIPSHRWFS